MTPTDEYQENLTTWKSFKLNNSDINDTAEIYNLHNSQVWNFCVLEISYCFQNWPQKQKK